MNSWMSARLNGVVLDGVLVYFAGVHKKEESNGEHVGDGNVVGGADNGRSIGGMDNGDWDGLGLVWWQISSGVAMELVLAGGESQWSWRR
jgi:hypothetical protein